MWMKQSLAILRMATMAMRVGGRGPALAALRPLAGGGSRRSLRSSHPGSSGSPSTARAPGGVGLRFRKLRAPTG